LLKKISRVEESEVPSCSIESLEIIRDYISDDIFYNEETIQKKKIDFTSDEFSLYEISNIKQILDLW